MPLCACNIGNLLAKERCNRKFEVALVLHIPQLVMENNMDQELTDAKSLERCLKKATLAWACTLTETIAFEVLRSEYGEILTSLLVYME